MFKALFDLLKTKDLLVPAVRVADDALGKSRTLTDCATAALFDGVTPEIDLFALDREINKAEIEVRRMVFQHLAGRTRADLVTSVVLLSTIIDIERIGDYAKNLYQQGDRLKGSWPQGEPFDEIKAMRPTVLEMFDHTAVALRQGDRELARSVIRRQDKLGTRCEELVDLLCQGSSTPNRHVAVGVLTLRYVKRIGAHLTNLASSVINPVDRIGFRPEGWQNEEGDRE